MKKFLLLVLLASAVSIADEVKYKSDYDMEPKRGPVEIGLEVHTFKTTRGTAQAMSNYSYNGYNYQMLGGYGYNDPNFYYNQQAGYRIQWQRNIVYQMCQYNQSSNECVQNKKLLAEMESYAAKNDLLSFTVDVGQKNEAESACATSQLKELNAALAKSKDALEFYKKGVFSKLHINIYDATLTKPEDNADKKPLKNEDLTIGIEPKGETMNINAAIDVSGKCVVVTADRIAKDFTKWNAKQSFASDMSGGVEVDQVPELDKLVARLNAANNEIEMKKEREPASKRVERKPAVLQKTDKNSGGGFQ